MIMGPNSSSTNHLDIYMSEPFLLIMVLEHLHPYPYLGLYQSFMKRYPISSNFTDTLTLGMKQGIRGTKLGPNDKVTLTLVMSYNVSQNNLHALAGYTPGWTSSTHVG
jgi:hypothetical protein